MLTIIKSTLWQMCMALGLFIMLGMNSFAQTTVTIGAGANIGAIGLNAGPIYRSSVGSTFDFSQHVYLYTAAELATAGILPGSTITSLAWNKSNAFGTAATNLVSIWKIYCKNSSTTPSATWCNSSFAAQMSGATLVYDNTAQIIPLVTGYITLTFLTPFTYTGGSLEIGSDWNCSVFTGSPTTGGFAWRSDNLTNTCFGGSGSAANASMSLQTIRPQIQLSYNPPPLCSAAPPVLNVTGPSSVCSGSSFMLGLSPAIAESGIAYLWESADDQNFTTNVSTVGTSFFQTTTQTSARYYRCNVTCTSVSLSTMSLVLYVPMSSTLACYCATSYTGCSGDGIINVELNSFINSSAGCPGAGNYTYFTPGVSSLSLLQGSTYTLNVITQSDPNQWTNAWIDFDGNGTLEAGEALGATVMPGANGIASITFTIPLTATIGLTRLRIRGGVDNTFTTSQACGVNVAASFGEIEDYDITIAAPPPCTGTPAITTVSPANATVCNGTALTLSVSSPGTASGYTYQWEESTNDTTYTPILGATNTSYSAAPIANMYYRCVVTCSNSNLSALSSSSSVTFDASADASAISGPATGLTYQSLNYSSGTTIGNLQWQFATALAGPYIDLSGQTTSTLATSVSSGGTFYIRLCASSPTCTTYSNIITTVVTVANDNVCDALPLVIGLNGPYTNQGATIQTGEAQAPNTNCNSQATWCSGLEGLVSHSVWFTIVAPPSGILSIELDTLNLWDSQIALWSASACGNLTSGLGTLIAANDDISGTPFQSKIVSACVVPGQTYYVQVDGYNATIKNDFGLLLTAGTNAAPTFVGCPANVTAGTACDATSAAATWIAPTVSDECNTSFTSSHNSGDMFPIGTTPVTYSTNDGVNPPVTCTFDVTVTSNTSTINNTYATICEGASYIWSVNGMSYSTAGYYAVTSNNMMGCTHTEALTLTVNPLPIVTAPNVSGCPGSQATLGGSPAGGTWNLPNPYSGIATSYTYTFTDMYSGCSNSATGSIDLSSASISSVNVTAITGISASVNYTPVAGIGWYEIRYKLVTSSTWTVGTNNYATTKPLINLTPNSNYEVQVRGFCSSTTPGSWSASTFFSTNNICGTPAGFFTTNITATTAKLNWGAVSGAGYYSVRLKPVLGSTWVASTTNAPNKSVAALTPSTNYEYQVRTHCGGSASAYSASTYFITNATKVGASVHEALGKEVNVYPNPTQDVLNIDLPVNEFTSVLIKVTDMSGRVVKQIQTNAEVGNNNITVSLTDLCIGVYTLQLIGNDKLMNTTRVIKN